MINLNNNSTFIDAIHNYQNYNFSIFPLKPNSKVPLTAHGFNDATKDLNQISNWWKQHPTANIGIATGDVSGFWVLDIDGKKGENSLKELQEKYGILPPTVEVLTGNDGRHFYFQVPQNIQIPNSVRKLGNGIDVRGDGGYIVSPPSIHPNGNLYTWSDSSAETIAVAPDWLIELIKNPIKNNNISSSQDWKELIKGVPEGARNDSLARIAGALLGSNLATEDVLELCMVWNDSRCEPPLDYEEVLRTFNSISQREANKEKQSDVDGIEIICMDDVEMKKVNWLWPDRIAKGKITVLAGQPGLGKSQITANIAATVTADGQWPDGIDASQAQGNVIILSAEDDASDTIKPRLVAAGANTKSCHAIQAVRDNKSQRTFDLKQDIGRLENIIKQMGNVSLIIIDPFSAYMGKTDSNNNSEVRGLLAPLSEIAAQHDVAILLVTHLNKSQNQDMMSKIIGSVGLVAAARAGYVVVKDELSPEKRHFVPVKNNIGNDFDGFSFIIEGVKLKESIQTSKVCWNGEISTSDALNSKSKTVRSKIEQFLIDLLIDEPVDSVEVYRLGKEANFSKPQLNRAKQKLGIKSRRLDFDAGKWEWYYFDPEDTAFKEVKSSASSIPSIKSSFSSVTLMSV